MPSKKVRARQARQAAAAAAAKAVRAQPATQHASHAGANRDAVETFLRENECMRGFTAPECMQCGAWGDPSVAEYAQTRLHAAQLRAIVARTAEAAPGALRAHVAGAVPRRAMAGTAYRLDVCDSCMSRRY